MCIAHPAHPIATPLIGGGQVERRRRENRGPEGAERVGCGREKSPSPLGWVLGSGCAPPKKIFDF